MSRKLLAHVAERTTAIWAGGIVAIACGIGLCPPRPASAAATPEQLAFFETKIRPVLVTHCYECHSKEAQQAGRLKAELLVDSRAGLEKGGESGPAVVPGKPDESLLLAALQHDGFEMPPSGRLPDTIVADVKAWIAMGAADPRDEPLAEATSRTIDVAAGRDHWSYRRLAPVSLPDVSNSAWPKNDIDRFILAKQEAAGVAPNDEAAKETLARRVFFDLIGLPPSPEELERFMADTSADAYEQLVDRLLASPRHGERWARHWLDAVRFGESGGYEFDGDRPGAYHYRDFVIRALDADMPFDEFLRLQVAGDVIKPGDYEGVSATGFLVAGPYPGQITSKTAEPIRYDQLDDMVQAIGSGILGMTIGCARCHDHKYDAIAHRDYYAMIACLKNTVHKSVDIDPEPEATKREHAAWEAERVPFAEAVERFRTTEFPGRLAAWLEGDVARQPPATWLVVDPVAATAAKAKLVEETGDVLTASGKGEPNENYKVTFRTQQKGLTAIRLDVFQNPAMPGGGPGTGKDGTFLLSSLKVTAAPLVPGPGRATVTPKLKAVTATFADAGFEPDKAVDGKPSTGWAVNGRLADDHVAVFEFDRDVGFDGGTLITVEMAFEVNQYGFARFRLATTTAARPAALAGATAPQAPSEIATLVAKTAGRDVSTDESLSRETLRWFRRFDADAEQVQAALDAIDAKEPKPKLLAIYAAGTGGGDVYVLKRGEVAKKGEKASPGFVRATIAADTTEAALLSTTDSPAVHPRLALARYLTDVESGAGPLTARVIVNRLWHHHFGRGIVATPNDLGTQGEPPTHPELLEWLAGRLVAEEWSLRAIHRLIVTSATYRQASVMNEANRAKDPDNLLISFRKPVRLEGETIRDALLAVAGKLDTHAMFGPGPREVTSPRRSVYLTVKRSAPIAFLQLFDQPEPVQPVGARGTATVPTQALAMLNSPFVRAAAEGLAARAAADGRSGEAAVERGFTIALGRRPRADEIAALAGLLAGSGPEGDADRLADVCQMILCLNEFVYVD